MKPTILLIRGPMACGKSTTVRALDKKLDDFILVDREYLKSRMLEKLGRERARPLSKKVVYFTIKELMKLRANIILQEMAESRLKIKLRNYFKKYNYRIKTFYLTCHVDIAIKRDLQRSKNMREENVKRVYAETKPEKKDFIIDTDKNSLKKVVNYIYDNL